MNNKRLIIIITSVFFLLSIPLLAMLFTSEVSWTLLDFVVMGILLLSIGIAIDLILRKIKTVTKRVILIVTVALVFLIIWAELAVGVFGSPIAGS